ncbi:hypothetical protein AQUCO_00400351v1 [Aquilegia coerulea]|uniref:Glycosyl transferase CAP10 domain-containing protein n=1 Tax=Aquilegia coerulea TaxID=218851 RepID=A0A2G5EUK0_AQUCA|nr:hypothetical protein AQUCO_00400351v1 [Aquilegia coerulea]
MGVSLRNHASSVRSRSLLFPATVLFSLCFFTALIIFKVDEFVTNTKTVVGHNLDPTPWHPFPPKDLNGGSRYDTASKIIQCSYLTCRRSKNIDVPERNISSQSINSGPKCPSFFRWIHHDLQPWSKSKISMDNLMEAQKSAAFRVVIVGGKLFVDFYYDCVQGRTMFTIWGFLQLLKRYPGMIPDVDIMFDCMDKPFVNRSEYGPETKWPPPPLFRYCTTSGHFDIPFPDWSFWGWVETNIQPWDDEFRDIKQGSQAVSWEKRLPRAYWKGNVDVLSPVRTELQRCNHSRKWGAQIMRQNWFEEAKAGYEQSKLANQCKYRYKIYAEGYAWSVSLKYIVSCGSTSLIISPQYEDFLSRGLVPTQNYWPVSLSPDLCRSIKFAVDWGNANPALAEGIGKRGQDLMEQISMDRVYDYMYHLIKEYSKLQDFKPSPPSSAQEVCMDSLLCFADTKQKDFLQRSTASPSSSPPCILPPANMDVIKSFIEKKNRIISDIQKSENN